ncbi:hypothetical protein [Oscillibacter sp.]|uniref:hypothetical protein n=1 Tax=Oscillibacter sp. TaxID=1945593 RepID=UPI0028A8E82F|nr:hypothetical protein [Oscillibacter sp.]
MRRETVRIRILAIALLSTLLAAAWLTEGYAATHLRHRCTGEDCTVCTRLAVCLQAVEKTGHTAVGSGTFSGNTLFYPAVAALLFSVAALLCPLSLLKLKIRLNN